VGGFVLTAIGVMLGTGLAVAALLPKPAPGKPARPTPVYLAANLSVSIIAAAVLGGYAVAYFAVRSPFLRSGILAAIFFVLSVMSAMQGPQPGQPV
jgi:uncharacterized membrane protein